MSVCSSRMETSKVNSRPSARYANHRMQPPHRSKTKPVKKIGVMAGAVLELRMKTVKAVSATMLLENWVATMTKISQKKTNRRRS